MSDSEKLKDKFGEHAQLPSLNYYQTCVLHLLKNSEMSGSKLRAELEKWGSKQTAPAFSIAMTRLEDQGMVESRYEVVESKGAIGRQKYFKIKDTGRRAMDVAYGFCATLVLAGEDDFPAPK